MMRALRFCVVVAFLLPICSHAFRAIANLQRAQVKQNVRPLLSQQSLIVRWSSLSGSSTTITDTVDTPATTLSRNSQAPTSKPAANFLRCGLLLSSFHDGLKINQDAHDFLTRALVQSHLQQQQKSVETTLADSAVQSPCCGPNMDAMEELVDVDQRLAQVWSHSCPTDLLLQSSSTTTLQEEEEASASVATAAAAATVLRVAYIPTAMYALRPESTNTPGKQRQRARADAKKRRTEIVRLLLRLWDGPVAAVTVDFDDGSVKQPVCVNKSGKETSLVVGESYPTTATQALDEWQPHLVYVEGGNTFWLYHCMEKGNYIDLLRQTLYGPTVYCGSSAGGIVVGSTIATASWKGWDDPRVVSHRPTYEDWSAVKGLDMVGGHAFFPHMTDDYFGLVETECEKRGLSESDLVCLRDSEVLCVRGDTASSTLV